MSSDVQLPVFSGYQWAREQQYYTHKELEKLLGIRDTDDLVRMVQQLKCAKILRTVSEKTQAAGEDDGETDDSWEKRLLESYRYSFRYVGILQFGKNALYILPKYCRPISAEDAKAQDDNRMQTLSTVLQVIIRYAKELRDLGEEDSTDPWQDFLHLVIELVTDYSENGVYRDDNQLDEINGKGRILWHRTIAASIPFIQDDSPVYTNLHTRCRFVDEQNYFTRMHHFLAYHAWSILHGLNLNTLLNLPDIIKQEDNEDDFSDITYMLYRLRAELGQQFDSRRRYLLTLMIRYLETKDEDSTDGYYRFGKSGFHVVWEEACRRVLNMHASNSTHMQLSRPKWHIGGHTISMGEDKINGQKGQQADSFHFDAKENHLLICDAKYYIPSLTPKSIQGMPGIADLLKQQLYELALRNYFHPNADVRNVFLLPRQEADNTTPKGSGINLFGRVHIPMLTASRLPLKPTGLQHSEALKDIPNLQEINLCYIDPALLWNAYLTPEKGTLRQELEAAFSCTQQEE